MDHVITSVVLQGRFANGLGQEFSEFYVLQFWREGMEEFEAYEKTDGSKVLLGNSNTYQKVESFLNNSMVIASKVRYRLYLKKTRMLALHMLKIT